MQDPGAIIASVLGGHHDTSQSQDDAQAATAEPLIVAPTSDHISISTDGAATVSSAAWYPEVSVAASTTSAAESPTGRVTYTEQAGDGITPGSAVASQGGLTIESGQPAYTSTSSGVKATLMVGSGTYTTDAQSSAAVPVFTTMPETGAELAISGATLSAVGYGLVVDGSTYALSVSPAATIASAHKATITIGPQLYTVTAMASGAAFESLTLLNGGAASTVSGQTVSAIASGVVVDGVTYIFQPDDHSASPLLAMATITVGSKVYTATALASGVAFASATLFPGGPAEIISGQTISLVITSLAGDGATYDTSAALAGTAYTERTQTETVVWPVAIGGAQYTAYVAVQPFTSASTVSAATVVEFDGFTLTVGGAATTVQGETISAAASALVVDGNSISFRTETITAGAVISESEPGPANAASTNKISKVPTTNTTPTLSATQSVSTPGSTSLWTGAAAVTRMKVSESLQMMLGLFLSSFIAAFA
ncbi:hypothetical protein MBLNU459_g2068t1 [Dothideomycetes sp. NU459]